MTETMQAQYYDRYGRPDEVLELREVEVPDVEPGQLLIKVHATSAQPLDWHLITGEPRLMRAQMGLRTKRHIPGADVAGTVEAIGTDVTRFQVGDEVFGEVSNAGAFAEYVAAAENELVHKPEGITFETAAALPVAGLTALQGLRDWGKTESGDEVLIVGASGGVGTFAVQIAKALGAMVTAVCSPPNVATAQSIGADRVIDYTVGDFTDTVQRYDVILDGPGNRPLLALRRMLNEDGVYVAIGGPKGGWVQPLPRLIRIGVISTLGGRRMTFGLERSTVEDLELLAGLVGEGKVVPVIDRNYKLAEAADALMYIGQGHARGKVVVTI